VQNRGAAYAEAVEAAGTAAPHGTLPAITLTLTIEMRRSTQPPARDLATAFAA